MSDSAIQGSPANRFTVSDLPMIGKYAGSRWPTLDDGVKRDVVALIKDTLSDQEAKTSDKLRAANLAHKIDSLNLKHEMFYTPKLSVSFDAKSAEDLDRELAQLEHDIEVLEALDILTLPDNEPPIDALPIDEHETRGDRLAKIAHGGRQIPA